MAAPLMAGACHDTVALPTPGTGVAGAGAVGIPTFTDGERAENRLQPVTFLAETVNVYALPLVNPTIVCVVAVERKTFTASATSS